MSHVFKCDGPGCTKVTKDAYHDDWTSMDIGGRMYSSADLNFCPECSVKILEMLGIKLEKLPTVQTPFGGVCDCRARQ